MEQVDKKETQSTKCCENVMDELKNLKESWILTNPKSYRLSSWPLKYPKLNEYFLKQLSSFWTAEEIEMGTDVIEWRRGLYNDKSQDKIAKRYLEYVLVFFFIGDGLVGEHLSRLLGKVSIREAMDFYTIQNFIETIHNRAYSTMLHALLGQEKIESVHQSLDDFKAVQNKAEWVKKWVVEDFPVQVGIVALGITESIFFSSLFAAIYHIKKTGKLKQLCNFNYLIARDENLHRDFACEMYNMVEQDARLPSHLFKFMVEEAVNVCNEFHIEALNGKTWGGFPISDIIEHNKHVANLLATDMGYEKIYTDIYNTPFTWLETMLLDNKGNFFETTPVNYSLKQRKSAVVANMAKQMMENPIPMQQVRIPVLNLKADF